MDENPVEEMSFEQALAELETIVRALEQGSAPLDESIELYQRGDRLKRHCEARLKAAQMRIEQIALGLESARPVKGRCVWRPAGRLRILDDTYNANPGSVGAALETLAATSEGCRRVVVFGDMLELGDSSESAHREMGRAVAASGAAEFVGLGRWAQVAVEAARAAGLAESHHVTTFEDAVALLLKRLAPGDAVLVKGSRGMRMERVVDALVARFGGDDA